VKPDGTKTKILQVACAEVFGTFLLTFIDAGIGIQSATHPGEWNLVARSLAPAAAVMALVYALGAVSGAHINPAVSLSFALRGVFPWRKVPLYLAGQLTGAALAALLLNVLFPGELMHGLTLPQVTPSTAALAEFLVSWFLINTILSVASEHRVKGAEAAIPVGLALIFCGLFSRGISGASMNPARSLMPALIAGNLSEIWIYIMMPILGGGVAVLTTAVLQGPPGAKDRKAAQGDS
jgi:MIP family channel proteins